MNPEVWGPPFWFFLHTLALTYPLHTTTVTKKKYYQLIMNLPLFIPNKTIGNYFSKLLDKFPVTPYLSSRMSFMKWMHFIHNHINVYLGKPEVDFYNSLELYYKQYEPKDIKNRNRIIERKRYISIGVLILISGLVIYLLKK